jgi:hypothetical protein
MSDNFLLEMLSGAQAANDATFIPHMRYEVDLKFKIEDKETIYKAISDYNAEKKPVGVYFMISFVSESDDICTFKIYAIDLTTIFQLGFKVATMLINKFNGL